MIGSYLTTFPKDFHYPGIGSSDLVRSKHRCKEMNMKFDKLRHVYIDMLLTI